MLFSTHKTSSICFEECKLLFRKLIQLVVYSHPQKVPNMHATKPFEIENPYSRVSSLRAILKEGPGKACDNILTSASEKNYFRG